MFSSRSSMVSCLIFMSLDYFEFMFYVVWGSVLTSLIYMQQPSTHTTTCWRDCFAILHPCLLCWSLTIGMWIHFWALCSVALRCCSVAKTCLTRAIPWAAAGQACLSVTDSRSLLKLLSSESVMPSNHLILCCPLLLLLSIFLSIRVFSSGSALRVRWPKYWSFSFSISPSNEYSGLISFRMDWLDLLAVQGTLKSLLQHHHWKASIFQHSAFFTVQLSHPYVTTGKTIALTIWTFVGKSMGYLSIPLNCLQFPSVQLVQLLSCVWHFGTPWISSISLISI